MSPLRVPFTAVASVPTVEDFYRSRRKELPQPATLMEEIRATGWRTTATKYGASDATIRKRLKKAGLVPSVISKDQAEDPPA
jgi:DNA invertase Pin-like site-specific DNA recombinase